MDARAVIEDGISRGRGVVERALDGLDDSDLAYRPSPEANPIGWMAWHIGRVEDMHVADLMGEEQLWTAEGFHERFGMPPEGDNFGTGNSHEQVNAVHPPSVQSLREYYRAVADRTDRYVATLSDAELDRELDEPQWTPRPTVGVRLNSLIHHVAHHGAQIAYLRGLLDGRADS